MCMCMCLQYLDGGSLLSFLSQWVQLHVEQEEDEAVESGAQAVTQASDARDHALHHACKHTQLRAGKERARTDMIRI